MSDLLEETCRVRQVTRVRADSLEELASKLSGVDGKGFLRTVEEYNRTIDPALHDGHPFDPDVLDGRTTDALTVPKSNWAQRIDEPPFEAYAVTCGITFTYGGVRIDTDAEVLGFDGEPVPGLYASGEMVGGALLPQLPRWRRTDGWFRVRSKGRARGGGLVGQP